LAITSVALLSARTVVLGSLAEALPPLGAGLLTAGVPRIWTVLSTWPEILRLLFFPADLSADYSPEVISIAHGWTPQAVLGLLIGFAALVGALVAWRAGRLSTRSLSPRLLGFGVVWFVITLSPTSNVLFLTGVMLAERTLYLPSVGFVAGVGWLFVSLHRQRPRVAAGLVTLSVMLLAGRTVDRNVTWKNNDTLFITMLSEHPESARAQLVAGNIHFQRGEEEQGLRSYGRALVMAGTHYAVLTDISRTVLQHGHEKLGEYLLKVAWDERPEYSLAPSQLALLYSNQGRWEEAERLARLTASTVEDKAGYTHLLAQALAAQNKLDEAVVARRDAIRLGLDGAQQWIWLAELEHRRGDAAAAARYLDTARTRVTGPKELAQVDSLMVMLRGREVADAP
ncbi:MAG: tetratricopeptide repeat protein, partial [Longimicrobiales bacterium]